METASIISDGYHLVTLTYDGTSTATLRVDNIENDSSALVSYSSSALETFFIGGLSELKLLKSGNEADRPTGYFQYTNRVRTAAERTADYAKAKAMHPTLP